MNFATRVGISSTMLAAALLLAACGSKEMPQSTASVAPDRRAATAQNCMRPVIRVFPAGD